MIDNIFNRRLYNTGKINTGGAFFLKLSKVFIILVILANMALYSDDMIRQAIELEDGWNLVLFNVMPADSSMSAVFSELIASGDLVLIKTAEESFLPSKGEYLNTLQNIDSVVDYAIRVGVLNTLQICGENIATVLKLRTGWNL
ncbi:MAG: hypothetical protein P9X26_08995 [Candidatus Stygibacter frigidus]|nr:hypothetical protein [Candidatus Stygibacter frigidus]